MSTKLQHRALRSDSLPPELAERPRFTSMIVPIDRSTRDQVPLGDLEVIELPPVVLGLTAQESKRPAWLPFAATALTAFLLIPVLCLALFPVSVLALACAPIAAAFYACTFGLRRDDTPKANATKADTVPVSRAA